MVKGRLRISKPQVEGRTRDLTPILESNVLGKDVSVQQYAPLLHATPSSGSHPVHRSKHSIETQGSTFRNLSYSNALHMIVVKVFDRRAALGLNATLLSCSSM